MRTFNIHVAKTHLSRLVDEAVKGDSFVIAKAGKPMVLVIPIPESTPAPKRRLGFMKGQYTVPENYDTMFGDEIEKLFYGEDGE